MIPGFVLLRFVGRRTLQVPEAGTFKLIMDDRSAMPTGTNVDSEQIKEAIQRPFKACPGLHGTRRGSYIIIIYHNDRVVAHPNLVTVTLGTGASSRSRQRARGTRRPT